MDFAEQGWCDCWEGATRVRQIGEADGGRGGVACVCFSCISCSICHKLKWRTDFTLVPMAFVFPRNVQCVVTGHLELTPPVRSREGVLVDTYRSCTRFAMYNAILILADRRDSVTGVDALALFEVFCFSFLRLTRY